MPSITRRVFSAALPASGLLAAIYPSSAQQPYPGGKSIRLVVPFSAGGSVDLIARVIVERLSSIWNAPVIVDNIAGAGSTIGTERVAHGAADGTQVLMTSSSLATIDHMYPHLSFNAAKDLQPLSLVASVPNLLCARKTLPVATISELVAFAKANPGKLNYGSAGAGTTLHLSGELFKQMANVDMVHVPYRGGAPAINDLISGNVDLVFGNIPSIIGHARSGSVKALGVTTLHRSSLAPEYPAIAETVPGFEITVWYGVAVRSGTAATICDVIEHDIRAICSEAGVRDRLAAVGAEAIGSTAAEFAAYVATERDKWGTLIGRLGISPL